MEITKQQFNEYEEVRQEGLYNMLDPRARDLTFLSKKEWYFIISNYEELNKKYN